MEPQKPESLVDGWPARLPEDAGKNKHIVDILIEERAEHLLQSPLWPVYKIFLYPLLRYGPAVRMADTVARLSAREGFDYISDLLRLKVNVEGRENIPAEGRVLIASTHPTGIADGVAMYDALKERRPDVIFFANRDALRAAPQLKELTIPVEWVEAKRTPAKSRETLAGVIEAFRDERCIVLFPSGRLAFMNDEKVLTEQDWQPSVAIFARKYDAPLVPARVQARNSWLYYWFWRLNTELRDITLFNELLNKQGKLYRILFGEVIPSTDLKGDPATVTKALQIYAEHGLAAGLSWRNPEMQD
ncbi:MAG: 1-acyl-sn-glycerol-3-phosphate acyltransferase [Parvularculaceae bacterium]